MVLTLYKPKKQEKRKLEDKIKSLKATLESTSQNGNGQQQNGNAAMGEVLNNI